MLRFDLESVEAGGTVDLCFVRRYRKDIDATCGASKLELLVLTLINQVVSSIGSSLLMNSLDVVINRLCSWWILETFNGEDDGSWISQVVRRIRKNVQELKSL